MIRGTFCILLLLSSISVAWAGESPSLYGRRFAIVLGTGPLWRTTSDEAYSPVRWKGNEVHIQAGLEIPLGASIFEIRIVSGRAELARTGGRPTVNGFFSEVYGRSASACLDFHIPLDREGDWSWWLGPSYRAHFESMSRSGWETYDGAYENITLGPVGRVAWRAGPKFEFRSGLAVALVGWLGRTPWGLYDPTDDWNSDKRTAHGFWDFQDVRFDLAVRWRADRVFSFDLAYEAEYARTDFKRPYRSLIQMARLNMVIVF